MITTMTTLMMAKSTLTNDHQISDQKMVVYHDKHKIDVSEVYHDKHKIDVSLFVCWLVA